jgi:tetratricopeptide (TPR) repeat protein
VEGPITRTCKSGLVFLTALLAPLPALAQVHAPAPLAGNSAYVRARAADADGASEIALAGYRTALAQAPEDALIAVRAYRTALTMGDLKLAQQAIAVMDRSKATPPDGTVLGFAEALRTGDDARADAALVKMRDGPLDFMEPILKAWVTLDRGGDPIAVLDGVQHSALGRRYAASHRALLLIAAKRPAEGLQLARTLLASDDRDFRIDAALLLAATGESKAARVMLAGHNPGYAQLRKEAGKLRPGAATGAARLFLSLAADLAEEDALPLSVVLTRAALVLDPGDDRARLYLAEALSRGGAHPQALAALAQVPADSPVARGAAAGRVAALRRSGRKTEALAAAQLLAGDNAATGRDFKSLGDLLADAGQYDAAATAYTRALAREGEESGWSLYYLQGSALNRAGRWAEALPALRRAVELAPDESIALEYLGTAQVSRGENLDEAQALLERAAKLAPEDAAIADSLAWAYFKRGKVNQALPLLEKAAQIDPSASQVNEHLGDAYWQLGRRYEARYAWKAAALHADAGAATRLADKLANGPAPQAN